MAGSNSDIQWPLGGLDRRYGFQNPQNGAYTTPSCLNVRNPDVFQQRLRGGSRPGLVQVLPPRSDAELEVPVDPEDPGGGGEEGTVPFSTYYTTTKATYITSGSPTNNWDATGTLSVRWASTGGGFQYRTLMEFDVSSLAAGAVVEDAFLNVRNFGSVPPVAWPASIYRLTTAWDEATATWNAPWTTPGGDYTITDGVSWNMFTYTGAHFIQGLATLVQDAIDNRSGILSIILLTTDPGGSLNYANTFYDDDGAGVPVAYIPVLNVEGTVPE